MRIPLIGIHVMRDSRMRSIVAKAVRDNTVAEHDIVVKMFVEQHNKHRQDRSNFFDEIHRLKMELIDLQNRFVTGGKI